MKFDGTLDIAIGMSAKSKIWKNKKISMVRISTKIIGRA